MGGLSHETSKRDCSHAVYVNTLCRILNIDLQMKEAQLSYSVTKIGKIVPKTRVQIGVKNVIFTKHVRFRADTLHVYPGCLTVQVCPFFIENRRESAEIS